MHKIRLHKKTTVQPIWKYYGTVMSEEHQVSCGNERVHEYVKISRICK